MRGLYLIPASVNISFVSKRAVYFFFSAILITSSIALFLTRGLNYGIDFKGGILIEVRTDKTANIGLMRRQLSALDLGEVALQEFGAPTDVLIRVQRQEGGEKAQQIAVDKIKSRLGNTVDYRRTEFVGPKVSAELFWDILTIAGYSINDTVVVYDRVRENLRKFKKMPLDELLNNSINQTLSRTVMTSVTTLLALLALFFLGGAVIRDFSFAMIWGVVIGTYSSICLAVPLLLYLHLKRSGLMVGDNGDDDKLTEGATKEAP